jgi:hypothetical protein
VKQKHLPRGSLPTCVDLNKKVNLQCIGLLAVLLHGRSGVGVFRTLGQFRHDSVYDECAGVLLLPATVYDHPVSVANARFRVGLGRRNLPQCLQALEDFLHKGDART